MAGEARPGIGRLSRLECLDEKPDDDCLAWRCVYLAGEIRSRMCAAATC